MSAEDPMRALLARYQQSEPCEPCEQYVAQTVAAEHEMANRSDRTLNRVDTVKGPAPKPCESCPYRRDVPSGVWLADEYAKLPRYDAPTYDQPANLFQCHQTDRDSDQARLCGGWVGCHGQELLSLRLAIADGRVDPAVMNYTTTVPLFSSGREAAIHGMRQIRRPGKKARDLIAKIAGNRSDVILP